MFFWFLSELTLYIKKQGKKLSKESNSPNPSKNNDAGLFFIFLPHFPLVYTLHRLSELLMKRQMLELSNKIWHAISFQLISLVLSQFLRMP